MKKLFALFATATMIFAIGCGDNKEDVNPDKPNQGQGQPNPDESPIPDLPPMKNNSDDICTAMNDPEFINYCYKNFDINNDGTVTRIEADAVRKIDISKLNITSIQGIGYFTNLERFICENCPQLREVELRLNTKLASFTFKDCKNLETVLYPKGLIKIADYAFNGCTNLKNITIHKGITSIGKAAFYDCRSLTSIAIPYGVTEIGQSAFYGCIGLKSITIPYSVTEINSFAFNGCSNLRSITIPDCVNSIGSFVFCNCAELTSIYCKPTTPPALSDILVFTSSNAKIYVPRASVDAYKSAKPWSDFASQIVGYDF